MLSAPDRRVLTHYHLGEAGPGLRGNADAQPSAFKSAALQSEALVLDNGRMRVQLSPENGLIEAITDLAKDKSMSVHQRFYQVSAYLDDCMNWSIDVVLLDCSIRRHNQALISSVLKVLLLLCMRTTKYELMQICVGSE